MGSVLIYNLSKVALQLNRVFSNGNTSSFLLLRLAFVAKTMCLYAVLQLFHCVVNRECKNLNAMSSVMSDDGPTLVFPFLSHPVPGLWAERLAVSP